MSNQSLVIYPTPQKMTCTNQVEFSTFSVIPRVAKVSQGLVPPPFLITFQNKLELYKYKYCFIKIKIPNYFLFLCLCIMYKIQLQPFLIYEFLMVNILVN